MDRQVFAAVVQQDTLGTLAWIDSLPEPQAGNLRSQFAAVYGRTRPAEALAWARSFDPPEPALEGQVIAQAALMDIDQAIQWFTEFDPPAGGRGGGVSPAFVATNVALYAANHPRRTEIANRLRAQSDDPRLADLLQRITARWVNIDPAGMLDWMLAGGDDVDGEMAGNVAAQLATRDAKLAASYLGRMPPNLRNLWLEQVAAPYARQDPESAVAWIAQLRAEPGYEDVLREVVQQSAQTQPRSAARMLDIAPESVQRGAARTVATVWSREDLAAAGRWAATIGDAEARSGAVETVADTWAYRDPGAAQRWVLSLPPGETRDAALDAVLSRFAREDFDVPIDRRVFEAFDSDARRQNAAMNLLSRVAASDPQRAESLLDEWFSDPQLRQRGEQMIERARTLATGR
jgi:hypothetical protein